MKLKMVDLTEIVKNILIEAFVMLKDSGKLNIQGGELGLSIVHKIIEAHKGTVNCCSDEENDFKISIEI